MAPGYRTQNRRQNRTGYVDHDVFEGLPVRQWRRDYVTVAPPPTQDNTASQNDPFAVELPYGMPKDSHLLPQHSQDLLRAARSGRIYKRPAPAEEEEADPDAILGEKPEKKDDDLKDRGFTAKAWKALPRHMEGAEIEYLAKRRKGLVTVASKAATIAPTLTKTTVKRIDAAGNEYVQDVVVPHGQQVEGRVISQTVIPGPNAVVHVDQFAVQPTPPKRKGPVPRKKLKGPGRGRKKKATAPTSVPGAAQVEGAVPGVGGGDATIGPDGVKIENEAGAIPTGNDDTEMADGSMAASDDDDGDEGEDGDEGDDDEGSIDNQNSPSKPPRPLSPIANTVPFLKETSDLGSENAAMSGVEDSIPPSLLSVDGDKTEGKSGSPLKNVALTTSTLTSPLESPTIPPPFPDITQAPQLNNTLEATAELAILNEVMERETAESAPLILPPPPPEPTIAEENAAAILREEEEEEEEEEMLLDIVDNANNVQIGADPPVKTPPQISPDPILSPHAEEPAPSTSFPAIVSIPIADIDTVDTTAAQEVIHPEQSVHDDDDDDDDFPDLLGGLEKSLEKPQAPTPQTIPTPAAGPTKTEQETVPSGEQTLGVEKNEESTGDI